MGDRLTLLLASSRRLEWRSGEVRWMLFSVGKAAAATRSRAPRQRMDENHTALEPAVGRKLPTGPPFWYLIKKILDWHTPHDTALVQVGSVLAHAEEKREAGTATQTRLD